MSTFIVSPKFQRLFNGLFSRRFDPPLKTATPLSTPRSERTLSPSSNYGCEEAVEEENLRQKLVRIIITQVLANIRKHALVRAIC